jgi:hypothetical protein
MRERAVVKPGKAALLAVLALACAVAVAPAHSQGRGGGGRGGGSHAGHHGGGGHHHGGGWHGSRVAIGFGFPGYWYGGWPYAYSAPYYGYGYPYAYYPPVSDAPYVGSFYVEPRAVAEVPQQPAGGSFYYYCAASRGYYPYVRQCPGGWERVPMAPPG